MHARGGGRARRGGRRCRVSRVQMCRPPIALRALSTRGFAPTRNGVKGTGGWIHRVVPGGGQLRERDRNEDGDGDGEKRSECRQWRGTYVRPKRERAARRDETSHGGTVGGW